MADFNRPLPQRLNERLRENLNAPQHDVESLSEKTKKGSLFTNKPNQIEDLDFPINGIVPDSKAPQKDPVNRGKIVKRDDNIKDINIGLQDHDEAINYYFNNIIKPSVINNGNRINVPLVYGNPERWKGVQKMDILETKKANYKLLLLCLKEIVLKNVET
jgi:hypothetical protein